VKATAAVLAWVLSGLVLHGQTPAMTNSVGMEFVLVRPGTMVVGRFEPPYPRPPDPSPQAAAGEAAPARAPLPARGGRGTPLTADEYRRIEVAAKADALPGFPVTIDRAYYIGKFEVTQAQWRAVMGSNPSIFQGALIEGPSDALPVDNVTWSDAQAFIRRLNALEKTTQYRLPTEFEWEFAARAGGEADIPWADIRQQAWAGTNRTTQAVGKMKPNAWGLYDMLGNVWEWVQDYYNEKLFADPTPPRTGKEHVLKGGGFVSDVKNAIPATHAAGPGSKFDVGFRVVRGAGN
jgi:formylglycine-generating enzyme